MIIRMGKAGEEETLCALADRCFSYERGWFSQNVGKFYGKGKLNASRHIVAETEGKIVGMIALCPEQLWIDGKSLSVLGVGTVCTAPEVRNQGILQMMMRAAVRYLDWMNPDFSFLDGKYERYHHFGFESAGIAYEAVVRRNSDSQYSFRPIAEWKDEDLNFLISLHHNRRVHGKRDKEDYCSIACQYAAVPFLIKKSGIREGILIYNPVRKRILELDTISDPKQVAEAFLNVKKIEEATVFVPGYDLKLVQSFGIPSQQITAGLGDGLMIRVGNFEKMLFVWMNYQVKTNELLDGSLILSLNGETFLLTVSHHQVSVQKTTQKPMLTLTHDQAVQLLFSSNSGILPESAISPLIKSWFPFPLCFLNGDEF